MHGNVHEEVPSTACKELAHHIHNSSTVPFTIFQYYHFDHIKGEKKKFDNKLAKIRPLNSEKGKYSNMKA